MTRNVSLKIVNARELAEKLMSMHNTDNELSVSNFYDVGDDGVVEKTSTGGWHGMKFVGFFDGYCLLVGHFGGGDWYAYDVAATPTVEQLEEIMELLLEDLDAYGEVCVEEVTYS